jgi:MiaB-like tRNA modifying enzyme
LPVARSLKPDLIESISLLDRRRKEDLSELSRYDPGSADETGRPKVWIEGYGCTASMADYEMITGMLKNAGFGIASKEEEGSLNLIVTCSVKDATEHRMVHRIKRFTKSHKPLVVAGCLPKADRSRVEYLNPVASLMGPQSIDRTVEIVRSTLSGQRVIALEDSSFEKVNIPRVRINPAVSIVEIASGCMSKCTFCQTKLAKGWLKSYRMGDILRQIRADVAGGCKEVWLTSTDNGCYGKDIGSDLVELLETCSMLEGDFKIRVGMMNPMYLPSMVDRMIELFATSDKIFKFLHIPVQSGSDRILNKMKRGHTAKSFKDIVRAFRERIEEITIATDIIVGYPSETDDDFEETLSLLRETEPDVINSSRYSPRPGTEAAEARREGRADYPSISLVKKRSEKLHRLSRDITKSRNSFWKGWTGEIIIDEIGGTVVQGRNFAYKPVVVLNRDRLSLGSKIFVRIEDFSNYSLKGVAIS